ncbi:hypothetical protein Lal_00029155 [Lupinus albus]|uniref:Uncharacterized protein n=1 Tax=Lupinus albus TaxID=3870 RepID=A0A6A5ND27_LUPAL|nr:hypothetical protein Lalb_Chr19g0134511 [Lupinus albus]KAF1885266.1 hypothetical protein Lal_00029155 [Lupinus albus]
MEAPKKNGILIQKFNDHWAFLEDIEAPMWADLTLEAEVNSVGKNMSDDWFSISHPFHQWSARELKSMFSHPGEGVLTLEVDAPGVSSPDLPSSVSRSRGKQYTCKKWGGINLNVLLDKERVLNKRCFQAGSSFRQEVKSNSKLNVSRPKGLLSAKSGLAFEHNARGNAKSMANCRNPTSSSSSVDNKAGESSTRSTITSENNHQQEKYKEVSSQPCDQNSKNISSVRSVSLRKSCATKKASGAQQHRKYMEVSSQPCGQKSGSSPVRRVGFRKSCVTKKALTLDIGGDSMKSRGRKSSSGKSSVGSSSNPGYEVEFVAKYQREKDVTINLAEKNKCKYANVSQRSSILVEGAKSSNQRGVKSRVDVGGDSMKSRGRKSTSGKSSVGSCSNPGYEVKFVPKHQREKIPDGKDVVTMNLADKNKCKPANISLISNYRKESNVSFAKPAYPRTAKSLVQCQSTGSLSLLPVKVNKENFCSTGAKEKLRTSKVNSWTGKRKENTAKNVTVNQKCTERVAHDGGMLKNHRTTECNHLQMGDTAGSSVLTILGKDNGQREAKNQNNPSKRIYLR